MTAYSALVMIFKLSLSPHYIHFKGSRLNSSICLNYASILVTFSTQCCPFRGLDLQESFSGCHYFQLLGTTAVTEVLPCLNIK